MCLALVTWCAHVSVMVTRGVGVRDADMSCADRGRVEYNVTTVKLIVITRD